MAPFSGLRSYADSGFVWCQHFLRLSIILGRMDKSIELRPGRHCVFTKHVHLVFVTKVRRGVFTKRNPGGRICGGDLRLCLPCFRSDTGRRRRRPCSPVGPLRAKGLRFRLGRCKSEDSGGNGVNLFQHRIESTHRLPHIELGLKTEPKSC